MASTTPEPLISYGGRITQLADAHPDQAALIFVEAEGGERTVSWRELERLSTQMARLFMQHGVNETSLLVVGLPNSVAHVCAALAGWKLGALVLPLRAALPAWERDRILDVGQPALVVADWDGARFPALRADDLRGAESLSDAPLPDRMPHPGRAIASGGSTETPKIIVDPRPWGARPGENYFGYDAGYRPGQVQLLAAPLYHNSPFGWIHSGLFDDHLIILMEHFDAARAVDLIERHRVQFQ